MSKTNSNSMTGLLIYALNNEDSGFRSAMFKYFTEQIKGNISEKTVFGHTYRQSLFQSFDARL